MDYPNNNKEVLPQLLLFYAFEICPTKVFKAISKPMNSVVKMEEAEGILFFDYKSFLEQFV